MLRSEFMARQPEHLRGIFSMGSFLVKNSTVLQQPRVASDDSRSDLPILMMHGVFDFCWHVMCSVEWSRIWSFVTSFLILFSAHFCTSNMSFLLVKSGSQVN
jgi:hypothetical protein